MPKRGAELTPLTQVAMEPITSRARPRTTVVFDISGLPDGFPISELGVNLPGTHRLLGRAGIGLGYFSTGDRVPFEPAIGRLDPVHQGVDATRRTPYHAANWTSSVLPVGQGLEEREYTAPEAAQILNEGMSGAIVRSGVHNLTTNYSGSEKATAASVASLCALFGLGVSEYVVSNPEAAGVMGFIALLAQGVLYHSFSKQAHKDPGSPEEIRRTAIAGTELPGVATLLYQAKTTNLIQPLPSVIAIP